jgi:D-serine deaminase-like pyridoxal phosphate-dependent protein
VATPPTHGGDNPTGYLARLDRATADLDPPFALVDLEAFDDNARSLARRACGKPIRVASKSVRSRLLLERALSAPGFRGVLAFTLPEALWLADGGTDDDIVVAYPSVDRDAIRNLAGLLGGSGPRITIMVDSIEHLDLIDAAAGPRTSPIRVCIDIDAGLWLLKGRVQVGAKRSPIRTPDQASAFAQAIADRDGFHLAGLMAYESQIAGVADSPPGNFARASAIRRMQRMSQRELMERRAAIVAAVKARAPLEFVNGGGTGSVELTSRDPSVTEVAAGSGFFAPVLFDYYRSFSLRPAAFFALPVVRRPRLGVITVLGGGYLASGPGDSLRLPQPYLPPGLRLDRQEGAGEVQTPLRGRAADGLHIGDRVYFRHAKAGELCEHFDVLHLIAGDRIVETVPTYRGEGRTFL